MVSKSKKKVCYAEAKDFVNLLLSFLSLPLGFVARSLYNADSFRYFCLTLGSWLLIRIEKNCNEK